MLTSLLASTSAPFASSALTTSKWPKIEAAMSGVCSNCGAGEHRGQRLPPPSSRGPPASPHLPHPLHTLPAPGPVPSQPVPSPLPRLPCPRSSPPSSTCPAHIDASLPPRCGYVSSHSATPSLNRQPDHCKDRGEKSANPLLCYATYIIILYSCYIIMIYHTRSLYATHFSTQGDCTSTHPSSSDLESPPRAVASGGLGLGPAW
jgi:hypothetical protein